MKNSYSFGEYFNEITNKQTNFKKKDFKDYFKIKPRGSNSTGRLSINSAYIGMSIISPLNNTPI